MFQALLLRFKHPLQMDSFMPFTREHLWVHQCLQWIYFYIFAGHWFKPAGSTRRPSSRTNPGPTVVPMMSILMLLEQMHERNPASNVIFGIGSEFIVSSFLSFSWGQKWSETSIFFVFLLMIGNCQLRTSIIGCKRGRLFVKNMFISLINAYNSFAACSRPIYCTLSNHVGEKHVLNVLLGKNHGVSLCRNIAWKWLQAIKTAVFKPFSTAFA